MRIEVIGPDRRPIAGVRVAAWDRDGPTISVATALVNTLSPADGCVEVPGDGPVLIRARRAGYLPLQFVFPSRPDKLAALMLEDAGFWEPFPDEQAKLSQSEQVKTMRPPPIRPPTPSEVVVETVRRLRLR